ncbi:MAG: 5'/3'-nucleotidase SurE [Schleiferiaceae bacterium]|jgi:5'-nucleotidase
MASPLILVTNDDGITAPGIRTLIHAMNQLGDVVVVAPDSPQSGMGHAITLHESLRLKPMSIDAGPQTEYACSGTPVDCVKLAVHEVLKDRKPDLIVSGVNHGSNASVNVIYSGTMSAAVEGAMQGVPSIGFSLLDYRWDADFRAVEPYLKQIAKDALDHGLPEGVCLNVNFPHADKAPYAGVRVARQALGYWKEAFEERMDPYGKPYYWMRGDYVNPDEAEDTDIWALDRGFVSIVPTMYDLTAHHALTGLHRRLDQR